MRIEVQTITNKDVWEDFLQGTEEKTFLQSWGWGEFQKIMGAKIWRFGVFKNDALIAVNFLYKIEAKRGTFLFIPHGPNIKNSKSQSPNFKQISNSKLQVMDVLLAELKKVAKEEGASFIRIAPVWERNEENNKIFRELGFKSAPIHIHPEASWKLDIRPSEEELLMKMRKSTRYLIRQAQKNKDIEIFESQKLEDVEIFNETHQKVVKTQKFVPFSLEYFRKEFLAFLPDNQVSLFFGKYKNQIVGGGYFVFWSGIGFYHHAALDPKFRKIPVSYLLLWKAIREAKKRGCKIFDFWGFADPQTDSKHPWAGPTLFKMGFGGYKKEYVETQDLPLSKKYWFNLFVEKIRKTKRGF